MPQAFSVKTQSFRSKEQRTKKKINHKEKVFASRCKTCQIKFFRVTLKNARTMRTNSLRLFVAEIITGECFVGTVFLMLFSATNSKELKKELSYGAYCWTFNTI